MNNNEQFVPPWAEKTLGPRTVEISTVVDEQKQMLWAFYDAWEALHAIKGDKRNPDIRKQYEAAAKALVDAAQPLRILRKDHGN